MFPAAQRRMRLCLRPLDHFQPAGWELNDLLVIAIQHGALREMRRAPFLFSGFCIIVHLSGTNILLRSRLLEHKTAANHKHARKSMAYLNSISENQVFIKTTRRMIQQLLLKIGQIIPLTSKDEKTIRRLFHEKTIRKNDYFVQEGQVCRQAAYIVRGMMRYFINADGEEKTYAFGFEDCFVSNYESFVPQMPSQKYIQALEDTLMLTISYHDLQQFYAQVEKGERFGRIVIEQVFLESLQEIASLYVDSAEQRYANFMKYYPEVQQRIPQYYIASYVGVKPQSLSRIRKRISLQS